MFSITHNEQYIFPTEKLKLIAHCRHAGIYKTDKMLYIQEVTTTVWI